MKIEKVNFKNSKGKRLVGDFYSANSDSAIIMCHGFTGDRHEWGRFDRIAKGLNKAGYNILNFDFSGSGESDDDSITVAKEVDDLKYAIKYIKNRGMRKIGLFGHSLGGLVCLKNSKGIEAMVVTAPVTNEKKNYAEKKFNKKQLEELRNKGYMTIKRTEKGIVRKTLIIDKKILKEREFINQKELLGKVKCPVLIIHGSEDESVPLEDSQQAINYLTDSKLEIMKGENHDLIDSANKIITLSLNWFKKYLK